MLSSTDSFEARKNLCKQLKGFQVRTITINRALGYICAGEHKKWFCTSIIIIINIFQNFNPNSFIVIYLTSTVWNSTLLLSKISTTFIYFIYVTRTYKLATSRWLSIATLWCFYIVFCSVTYLYLFSCKTIYLYRCTWYHRIYYLFILKSSKYLKSIQNNFVCVSTATHNTNQIITAPMSQKGSQNTNEVNESSITPPVLFSHLCFMFDTAISKLSQTTEAERIAFYRLWNFKVLSAFFF